MRRFVETVLFGWSAAASISVVDGQQITAKSKEKIVDVGFMNIKRGDSQGDEYVAALETDSLLTGEGVNHSRLMFADFKSQKHEHTILHV